MPNEIEAATAANGVARVEDRTLDLILRAALDPAVSPEKMSALFDLHAKMADRAARLEFAAALARAQAKFPIVERNGKILVFSKTLRERADREGAQVLEGAKPQQQTDYALYEDVVEAITKPLSEEGLSLSTKVKTVPAGDSYRIIVVGILKHRDGWAEEAETPPLQHDATGSKNAVQAVKSSFSYGKRMVAEMLTNVVSRGDDDDGAHGIEVKEVETINDQQYADLDTEITAQGSGTIGQFLKIFQIAKLGDLPAEKYEAAMARLKKRREDAAAVKKAGDNS